MPADRRGKGRPVAGQAKFGNTRRDASLMIAAAGLGLAARSAAMGSRPADLRGGDASDPDVTELTLDGPWQAGLDRHYDRVLSVPGLATDPAHPTSGRLWYKREVRLPAGRFTRATLTLKGARFAPEVYVDGVSVSRSEGGMAPTEHRFAIANAAAARTIVLEIALHSLDGLNRTDASAVPGVDRWRSNVSSCLWDSVVLRLHGEGEVLRVLPTGNVEAGTVTLAWALRDASARGTAIRFAILDAAGRRLVESGPIAATDAAGHTTVALKGRVAPWSPEQPNLYRLRTELLENGRLLDRREQNFGLRAFGVEGLDFSLNGARYPLRMGTVVWHRWCRDPEARRSAFDTAWFQRNVIARLKALGANALRFHLGLPPETLLDLCDREGLAVQAEWPFFHGIDASDASMRTQWQAWLDAIARHPCIVVIQPWNETGGDVVTRAWAVLAPLLQAHPPLVVDHRDITPVHKYWWSLFENVGLYYDHASDFGTAVMADEFGGNYLDGNGDPGSYPTTTETFLRFLGRDNTRAERLQLHADSNARIAEYWRRVGVAGFSPFCILGSPQDGSHWYLGSLDQRAPAPKPVWQALSAAYAPASLSLEVWNRNFAPGEKLELPLWLFNDTAGDKRMRARVHVVDGRTGVDGAAPVPIEMRVPARESRIVPVTVTMPDRVGEWRLEARLDGSGAQAVISAWQVRTFMPSASRRLLAAKVGVANDEPELRALLARMGVAMVDPTALEADVVIGAKATWARMADGSGRAMVEAGIARGRSVILLDAGPQPLGVGYETGALRGGPLEGAPRVDGPALLQKVTLCGGVSVSFVESAEPESCLQQDSADTSLWRGVPHGATWLWNGYRGGLIVPAADMQVDGLRGPAVMEVWQTRGADPAQIMAGPYFAYELAGYYGFSARRDDGDAIGRLRRRVRLLIQDAPSLRASIDPDAPVVTTDLHAAYRGDAPEGMADSSVPMAAAGKGLTRCPVLRLGFAQTKGQILLSQLLTAGRLVAGRGGSNVYDLRYDPVAAQYVLNMLDRMIELDAAGKGKA